MMRLVSDGSKLPRGFGVAWRSTDSCYVVCLPWGINWVAGAVRAGYLRIASGCRPSLLEVAYAKGYEQGFQHGLLLTSKSKETIELAIANLIKELLG